MKTTTKLALFLAAAFIALPVAKASAETTPGWYVDGGFGMNFQQSTGTIPQTGGGSPAPIPSFSFDKPGFDAMASGGYGWDFGLRTEAEYFHSYAAVKNLNGSLTNNDIFANAIYDIPVDHMFNTRSMFTPYVGAGVGLDFVDANNMGPIPVGTTGSTFINGSTGKFAWQFIAGVAAQIDPNWAVTADYRYVASVDPEVSDNAGRSEKLDNFSNNVMFSVRYSFDTPEPIPARATTPPPVHTAAPMARPAVAPVPQTFEVFFDFNKADLTPEAKRIIAAAAEEYKGGKYIRIVVTGHTDTVGTAKYNKTLSERRAAAVKAEFGRLGVDASVVVTKGVGKDGLLVPTNDQVREAQNRRAEIVLGKK